ncbi:hypothetical protein [Sorangium sp. So ce117]|uniref:hypothetical protein n=1 Tax=Sorangium sp. So ce117 TaxID=3133277 RepID=UPI003F5D58E0
MPVRHVMFNALPDPVRDRLVRCLDGQGPPRPILSAPTNAGAGILGWSFLALAAAAVTLVLVCNHFGSLWSGVQGTGHLLGYAGSIFLLFVSTLMAIKRLRFKSTLPFRAGRYLLPADYVDATGPKLTMIPMSDLVNVGAVHHHTNGVYSHSRITFSFQGNVSQSFDVRSQAEVQAKVGELEWSRQALRAAFASRDVQQLIALDPFFEVRRDDAWDRLVAVDPPHAAGGHAPRVGTMPSFLHPGFIAGASTLVAVILALPLWYVRNLLSDEAMFRTAKEVGSEFAYEGYIHSGRRHLDEVKTSLLPRAALTEAKREGSVTALRAVLKKYPGSVVEGETRAAVHELFSKTLADFRAQASTSDPVMLSFMEKLISYLEKSERSTVEVRFDPPSTDMLAKLDAVLQQKAQALRPRGAGVAPVAKHFDVEHSLPREAAIVNNLAAGFKRVFPTDILELKQGERLTDNAGAARVNPSVPTIYIHYDVGSSGTMYSGERSDRAFVGILVDFDGTMRIPGVRDAFDFKLKVMPPDEFTVEYTSTAGLGANLASAPPDDRVYEVMALRAFDQLAGKLRSIFFKPGSMALQGADESGPAQGGSAPDARPLGRSPRQ